VLISKDGHAVISDFGTSRLWMNNATIEGSTTFKHSTRWTAPELFQDASKVQGHLLHSKETDVWAFGMVVYVRATCVLYANNFVLTML
jgi:serine/threonine protein kinase